jgi:hypothetical protein
MDRMKHVLLGAMLVIAMVPTAFADDYKMTTPIAPGVATPDKLETSIGTLNLSDGNPDADTVQKIYDGAAGLPTRSSDCQPGRHA